MEFSTTKLLNRLIPKQYLGEDDTILKDYKFSIDLPELRIKNSRIVAKPGECFDTLLFLPEGEERKGEGGLRTRGYLKSSYKLVGEEWYICDFDGNPSIPAQEDTQRRIKEYLENVNQTQVDNKTFNSNKITELPLITVITVVLNGEKYLEQTIQSVITQTYPNIEYIIIDGGSTDKTLDIIKKYEHAIDYWVSEKDKGIYDAMNKGIIISNGNWIGFLGSDDYYERDALFNLITPALYDPTFSAYIIYGNSKVFLDNEYLYTRNTTNNPNKIVKDFIFFHPDSIAKINIYKQIGLYDDSFKLAGDYEFFLRAYFKNFHFSKVNKIVVNYRLLGFSYNYKLALKEKLKLYKKYKNKLGIDFLFFSFFSFFKSLLKDKLKLKETSSLIRFYRNLKNYFN